MTARAFFAYPSEPAKVGEVITAAIATASDRLAITPWPKIKIEGLKIDELIRDHIDQSDWLLADITFPNFNVYYEIGYALAKNKPVIPTVNISFENAIKNVGLTGIFDTIGQLRYESADVLGEALVRLEPAAWIQKYVSFPDHSQPLFILDTLVKTDFRNWIFQAVDNTQVQYRSFDPDEIPRLSAASAIMSVSASSGVIVPLISDKTPDAQKSNLRAGFIAGLAHGFVGDDVLLVQYEDVPAPLDYRDFVNTVRTRMEVHQAVEEYCQQTLVRNQRKLPSPPQPGTPLINRLNLGASAAENEFQDLALYFLETAEFNRALRSPSSVVVGRKGSGKSAVFFMVRDRQSSDARNLIVDLKPASHRLSDLREALLEKMELGLFDHTIAAFWQFIIYAEILIALRTKMLPKSKYNLKILEDVTRIEEALMLTEEMAAADFTARLELVVRHIVDRIRDSKLRGEALRGKITNFIFTGDLKTVRDLTKKFCAGLPRVTLLFDNLDKGWPASKIEAKDIRIVRLLLEALQRVQRELEHDNVDFQHLIFLRDDVYELLVQETPDRGKYNVVRVDWSDSAQLKQLILRRVDLNARVLDVKPERLWGMLIPVSAGGKSTFDTMVEYSLMRPRFLIELIERALAYAVNRGHAEVTDADVDDALKQHSLYLVSDFGYEIRDVSGLSEDIFYHFIGVPERLDSERLVKILQRAEPRLPSATVIHLLLWYGFLGLEKNSRSLFIFDTNYDMRRLEAEIRLAGASPIYCINPAFLKGLS